MTKEEEVLLVKRLKEKDTEAISGLVDAFSDKIYNLALGLLKNEQDAEDVVQDTLLQVFEKIGSFREEAALSSWIYRIALNFSYMRIRKIKRDDHLEIEEHMPRFQRSGMHMHPVVNWPEATDDSVMRKELGRLLRESIDRLPEKYRVVLTLRDVQGLSTEEVAEVTGMTVAAVKSRLHRARLFLRERLAGYYSR